MFHEVRLKMGRRRAWGQDGRSPCGLFVLIFYQIQGFISVPCASFGFLVAADLVGLLNHQGVDADVPSKVPFDL
jgi:hypothetical protein